MVDNVLDLLFGDGHHFIEGIRDGGGDAFDEYYEAYEEWNEGGRLESEFRQPIYITCYNNTISVSFMRYGVESYGGVYYKMYVEEVYGGGSGGFVKIFSAQLDRDSSFEYLKSKITEGFDILKKGRLGDFRVFGSMLDLEGYEPNTDKYYD